MNRAATLLDGVRIDRTSKGLPWVPRPVPVLEAGDQGWTLEDLRPPFMVLRRSALEHNLALMAAYCAERGVAIAPHGKTTMAPQLWWMQLDAGAWGISAATPWQARVMRAAGVPRILVANPVTDVAAMRWMADDLREEASELVCYVDSEPGVRRLENGLRALAPPRPLSVLVELGHAGGRTGCRGSEQAISVARLAARSPNLELVGVAGYEGTISHDREPDSLDDVRRYLGELGGLALRLLEEGLIPATALVSAGGSRYFDLVVEELGVARSDAPGLRCAIRAGAYLVHDDGSYERTSPFAANPTERRFRSAIEVWGEVLSTPEDGLAIVGLGRRDVPEDQGLPRALRIRHGDGGTAETDGTTDVTALDDQHLYCRLRPGTRVEVGDLVVCGVSHPCTAFDRWRLIPVLDDEDRVLEVVATFF